MSLINDALKKAARQRAEEPSALPPMPGGGRRPARSGRSTSTQTAILIGAAALALIVVSAVITGILVGGRHAPAPAAAERAAPTSPAPNAPPQVIVQLPPMAAVTVPRTPSPVPPVPSPAPVVAVQVSPASAVVAQPVSPVPPPAIPTVALRPSPPPAQPVLAAAQAPVPAAVQLQSRADQAQGFVDSLHVTGVRAAGSDSKVLINGHVYRVNDVLNRALGIKLVGVDSDHLTFVDADGASYLKSL